MSDLLDGWVGSWEGGWVGRCVYGSLGVLLTDRIKQTHGQMTCHRNACTNSIANKEFTRICGLIQ